ncbi:flagellar hook-length control protein FliK [Clostridium uliginosum]|uniref:DED domain-containing protein n=1 Tax=Clostridium uliginosum TaxID=119641 RepID=A0A1I1MXU1_9CLOT|nr:flagellar hook-length control protein FliK [Clostridium uliginosum]SFC86370.1 hypothetical protein SAMN05421842_11165 [Clostridium uliginosum]
MPGIWNVNNVYTNNTKKISSKLTFEAGEKFTGRIVGKGEGKDVTIRLSDGWQFIAELDENVNLEDLKLVRFQVDDFKDGKLKLVIADTSKPEVSDDVFQEIIEKEGLSSDDVKILEKMLKHDMALTRENINKVKGLIQFNENINANPEEIDTFIANYLQSKGIDSSSLKGEMVKQNLTEFFNTFKDMSAEEIIIFIENNLDFSKENIDSFNKLFKGNMPMEKLLMQLSSSLDDSDTQISRLDNKDITYENIKVNAEKTVEDNETVKSNNMNSLISKLYDSNDNSKNKVSMLSLMKSIVGNDDELLNSPLNEVINSRTDDLTTKEYNRLTSIVSKISDKDIIDLLKNVLKDKGISLEDVKTNGLTSLGDNGKSIVEETISKALGKEIKLTNEEAEKFNDLIKYKLQSETTDKNPEPTKGNTSNVKEPIVQGNKDIQSPLIKNEIKNEINSIFQKDTNIISNKDLIQGEIRNKLDGVKDIVKDIISNIEQKGVGYEKVMELIKTNINDFKVFNSINNEYYYLNFPVHVNSEDYPCKLIIKDNRKDGKKIDKTNAKMVVNVKTINIGEVDGYLTLGENKIDVNLRCEKDYMSILANNKNKLINGLETLGLSTSIKVSLKEEEANLVTCGKFFNDSSVSSIDIKV